MEKSVEQRLQAVEDRLAIYNLIAGHPLSADTGADYYTRTVFTEDGVFDRGSLPGASGRDQIAAFIQTPEHKAAIEGGLAHFAGLPYIELNGDEAFVTSYLQLIVPDSKGEERELSNHGFSKGFRIHRVLANRWSLVRTPEGWKIKSRKLIALDGSKEALQLLEEGLQSFRKK
jgi:hypothetical protein